VHAVTAHPVVSPLSQLPIRLWQPSQTPKRLCRHFAWGIRHPFRTGLYSLRHWSRTGRSG